MRKRTLGVVLLAGLAMSGAGAFTATNDVSAVTGGTTNVAGYGAATVTGATVTAVDYTQDSADASLIDQIKFVATGNLVSKEASVSLLQGSTNVGNYTCTGAAGSGSILGIPVTSGDTIFTCSTPDEPIASFNSLGITVNN